MDRNADDIDRNDLDILLTEDNNEDNGNNNASINTILQQLLSATTNLQSSANDINVTMNEMKSHQPSDRYASQDRPYSAI